jgi:hypothetical protein
MGEGDLLLGRTERDFLACFDLDRFTGCKIAPHASSALPDLQDAKTRNTDSFAFLEMLGGPPFGSQGRG